MKPPDGLPPVACAKLGAGLCRVLSSRRGRCSGGRGEQLLQGFLLLLRGGSQGLSQLLLRHHVEHLEGEQELVLGCADEGVAQEVGKAPDSVLLGVQRDTDESQYLRTGDEGWDQDPGDSRAVAGGADEPLGWG